MSKLCARSLVGPASALTITALLVACGVESKEIRNQDDGVVVAAAAPAPEGRAVTKDAGSTSSSKAKPTSVSYDDAKKVFRKGQYKDAAELFASHVAAKPGSVSGQYMLGLSAWKSGDHARAELALQRAVELDSLNVKALTNLGRVLLERGKSADALPHVELAVELKPESHEVWRVLGNVFAELGRSEEALEAYREAIVLNEKDSWSMNNYGLVLIKLGRYEEALPPLARAVELTPRSPVFQNNLGVALERSEQLAAARQAFVAAIESDSTYVKARISLERVQARTGGHEISVDLPTLAQRFVEEIERWRIGEGPLSEMR